MEGDEELEGGWDSHRDENEEKKESEREVGIWGHPSSFTDPQGPPHMPIHQRTCLHLATNDNVTPSTGQSLGQPCSLDTHNLEPTQPRAQDPNPNTDCLGRPCVRTGLPGLVQKLTGHREKL